MFNLVLFVCISNVLSQTTFNYCSPTFALVEDHIWRTDYWNSNNIDYEQVIKHSVIVTANNGITTNSKQLETTLRENGEWNGTFHIETVMSQSNTRDGAFRSSRIAKIGSFNKMFDSGFSRVMYIDSDVLIMKPLLRSVLARFLDISSNVWNDNCDIYVQRPSSSNYMLNGGLIIGDKRRSFNITNEWLKQVLSGDYSTDQDAFESLSLRNGLHEKQETDNRQSYCYLPNDVGYPSPFILNLAHKIPIFKKTTCTVLHFKGGRGKELLTKACDSGKWPCDFKIV